MTRLPLPLVIAIGGALGAVARHTVALLAVAWLPQIALAGTLAANGTGSFLIGVIAVWSTRRIPSPTLNGFLVTGFCGGFTTFSVFSLESLQLAVAGLWLYALAYIAVSVAVWLSSVWLGWQMGMRLFPERE